MRTNLHQKMTVSSDAHRKTLNTHVRELAENGAANSFLIIPQPTRNKPHGKQKTVRFRLDLLDPSEAKEQMQKKAFTRWINNHLAAVCPKD